MKRGVLHTITLAGRPLRIHASPRSGPDHPFAAFDDLVPIADADEAARAHWLEMLRANVSDELHELPDGTLLLSEPMVGGLFLAWVEMGCEPAQALLDQWHDAWTEVFAMLHSHLSRSAFLTLANEAAFRNVPHVPGVTVMQ